MKIANNWSHIQIFTNQINNKIINFKKGRMKINKPKITQKFQKVFTSQEEVKSEFKENKK